MKKVLRYAIVYHALQNGIARCNGLGKEGGEPQTIAERNPSKK